MMPHWQSQCHTLSGVVVRQCGFEPKALASGLPKSYEGITRSIGQGPTLAREVRKTLAEPVPQVPHTTP